MRVLVSGANGFVGRYLIRHLLQVMPEAQIMGMTHQDPLTSWDPRLRLISCDITAPGGADLRRLVAAEPPDHVYHLAGAASGAASDREAVFSVNVAGTQRLMAALAEEAPLARCLFVSTGYVYGPCDALQPAREEDALHPLGVYAESKRDAELWARGAGAIVARAFNHTGPEQTEAFAVPAFAKQIARIERGSQPPQIQVGNLEALRDFLDVRDVVQAYHGLMNQGVSGETYNVCRGVAHSLKAVLDDLLALSFQVIDIVPDPKRLRPADIPISLGSPAKLSACTGWRPQIPFAQTLRETLNWWRSQA